jgi:transcriptional regulator with XRE-family HTH domain
MANPNPSPTEASEQAVQLRIAGVIKLFMAYRDESQADLGAAIGLGQTDVIKILNGRKKLTVEVLERIATHYDIGFDVLFSGPEGLLRSRCFPATAQAIDPRYDDRLVLA